MSPPKSSSMEQLKKQEAQNNERIEREKGRERQGRQERENREASAKDSQLSITAPTGRITVKGKIGRKAVSGIMSKTPASARIAAETGGIEAEEVGESAVTGVETGAGGEKAVDTGRQDQASERSKGGEVDYARV